MTSKPGQERPWHSVQVMIYQYALPLTLPQYRNFRIGGEVVYPTHTVETPRGALPGQFIKDLGSLIRRLAADTPPSRVPSPIECRFCEITAADCPEHLHEASKPEVGVTHRLLKIGRWVAASHFVEATNAPGHLRTLGGPLLPTHFYEKLQL